MASSSVLERLIVQLVGDGTSFQRMIQGAVRDTFAATRGITASAQKMADNVTRSLDKVSRRFMSLGRILAFAITIPVVAAGYAAVKLAADWETAGVGFEVLLGSASKAAIMLEQIRKMAVTTPFDNVQLRDAAKILLNYGVVGENIMPMLRVLGDISMGNADKLHRLSIAYGQAMAAGRLMGQDLLQMINAGFNPLQEISKRTGETMAQLRDRMHAGQIGTAELTRAFADAVSEGGRFHNMMERMSKTLEGRWSTLVDVTKILLTTLGTDLMPILKQLVEWGIATVDWVNKLPAGLRVTIVAMTAVAAAAGPFLMVLGYMATAGAAVAGIVSGIIGLGPVVPIVAALAAGVVALGAALAAAVFWVVGPKSLSAAWTTATAAIANFVKLSIGFIANLQHNMQVLYVWLGENWSFVFEDMLRLVVVFAANTVTNFGVLVETAMRIFMLWRGYMSRVWQNIFTVDMVNWVVRGILAVKLRFIQFAMWASVVMANALRGNFDTADLAKQLVGDYVKGLTTTNIGEATRKIIEEQFGKFKLFEGFESTIGKAPEFKFDMPKGPDALDGPIKDISELRDLTDDPMEVKFKITGLDALEYGSAKMAEAFEKYNKEAAGIKGFRMGGDVPEFGMAVAARPVMPVAPGERVGDTAAIGASTAGHTLTADDRGGFFGGGESERKAVLEALGKIATNTEPKKIARQAIVFQPANLKGRS